MRYGQGGRRRRRPRVAVDRPSSLGVMAAVAIVLVGCAATPSGGPAPGTPTADPAGTASPESTPAPTEVASTSVPIITSAEWNEPSVEVLVAGIVPGTVDASEPCVVTAELGASIVEHAVTGEPGPSSVDCGRIAFTQDELGPGVWTFVLSFAGQTSDPVEVEVP